MNSAMNNAAHTAYYLLRAAQHHFDTQPHSLSAEQSRWLQATVLKQQALEAKVLSSAAAANVVVPDALLRRSIADVEAQYDDRDSFLSDLQRLDLTVVALNDLLERQLRVELVLEQQAGRVARVTRAAARRYYAAHPDKFCKPEQRQTWHLLITVNPDFAENSRPSVLTRLNAIRAEVDGDLQRFQQQAQRHSECPSALNNGEMGWIPAGHLFPEIDQALFALDAGQVSELIETEVGLHLVMCSAIRPAQTIPFEAVVDNLRDKLTEAEQHKARQHWLRSLA